MYISSFLNILPIVTGVASLVMGFVIATSRWRNPHARVFAVFSLVLAVWLLGATYMMSNCAIESKALYIDKWIYVVVSAIPAVLFHFTSIYSNYEKRKISIIFGYSLMVCFWFLAWSPYFVDGLFQFTNGCHSQARVLHHFFLLYFGSYSSVIIYDSFVLYKGEIDRLKKKQYQFIFFALIADGVVAASAFLPAYNINSSIVSNIVGFIATVILIYAMFRQDLFELKVIAIKIFIIFVVAASLFQVVVVGSNTLRFVNGTVFFIVLGFGYLVMRNVREEQISREKGERLARYLANVNARLRELDKQKTEFVSIASHQLRSPIAAIKGYTSMIIEGSFGKVPKHLNEPLSRILESGQRIGIMVDDFLNVTRIEQGRMSYVMSPHNVHTLVQAVVNEMRVVAEKKGLALSVDPSSDTSCTVKADEGKLKQIFSNIIDNSIKYTPQGSITIFIEKNLDYKKVLVKMQDTGIGIAPEEIQNLFQKFNRASNANEINVLGTGLGLYIAREIMKAHEGWIHVESEGLGKGSVFTVELPLCEDCGEGV